MPAADDKSSPPDTPGFLPAMLPPAETMGAEEGAAAADLLAAAGLFEAAALASWVDATGVDEGVVDVCTSTLAIAVVVPLAVVLLLVEFCVDALQPARLTMRFSCARGNLAARASRRSTLAAISAWARSCASYSLRAELCASWRATRAACLCERPEACVLVDARSATTGRRAESCMLARCE